MNSIFPTGFFPCKEDVFAAACFLGTKIPIALFVCCKETKLCDCQTASPFTALLSSLTVPLSKAQTCIAPAYSVGGRRLRYAYPDLPSAATKEPVPFLRTLPVPVKA